MPSILSADLKQREFTDPGRPATIVDFKIDDHSLHELLLAANRPFLTPRSSLPGFTGLPKDTDDYWNMLLVGFNPRRSPRCSNLAPLMGCGDCGSAYCGGVWTRIFVGMHHVNWAGFMFWDGIDSSPRTPCYLDRLVVFEREPYERPIRSLIKDGT